MIADQYTVKDAAQILQVSERTLRGYIKSGKLKARKFGYVWRIAESDLSEFLEAGCEQVEENRRPANRGKEG